jgi:hypothetical protein
LEAQNEYSAIPKILPANSRPMAQIVKLNQRSNTRTPRKRVVSKIGGKLSLPYYKIGFVMLICVAAIFLFHSLFEDNLGLFENLLHVNSADTLEGK